MSIDYFLGGHGLNGKSLSGRRLENLKLSNTITEKIKYNRKTSSRGLTLRQKLALALFIPVLFGLGYLNIGCGHLKNNVANVGIEQDVYDPDEFSIEKGNLRAVLVGKRDSLDKYLIDESGGLPYTIDLNTYVGLVDAINNKYEIKNDGYFSYGQIAAGKIVLLPILGYNKPNYKPKVWENEIPLEDLVVLGVKNG